MKFYTKVYKSHEESALHILSERGTSVPSLKQEGLKSCTPTTANQQCYKNLKIALMKASAIEARSLFESPCYRWIATKMKRVRNYAVVFRAKYFLCEVQLKFYKTHKNNE